MTENPEQKTTEQLVTDEPAPKKKSPVQQFYDAHCVDCEDLAQQTDLKKNPVDRPCKGAKKQNPYAKTCIAVLVQQSFAVMQTNAEMAIDWKKKQEKTTTQRDTAQRNAAPQTTAPQPAQQKKETWTVDALRQKFPEDLESMLSFEQKPEYIQVKPKQFLGSENFAKIASTIRGVGGEYISAGQDSHFRVYTKTAQQPAQPAPAAPTNGKKHFADGILWTEAKTQGGDPCEHAYLHDNMEDGGVSRAYEELDAAIVTKGEKMFDGSMFYWLGKDRENPYIGRKKSAPKPKKP